MQKRLARKLDLEILLSNVKQHATPNPRLEQYATPASVAAQMLYMAAYTYDDIVDKTVLDLGCGTGRLALGAAFLGAKQIVGVDIDKNAVKTASENALNTGLEHKVQWIVTDIDTVHGQFDTVLQNPPFGVQKRGADLKFLEKALKTGGTVYSLHKSPKNDNVPVKKQNAHTAQSQPSPFLRTFIDNHGGNIRAVYRMPMTIPHMFSFHSKKKHDFPVDLYIIDKMR